LKLPALFIVVVGFVALAGCGGGSSEGPRLPTIPVKGKLTIDGKPAGNLMLTFSPVAADQSEDKAVNKTVSALVKQDGTFVLQTYKENDGAPVGSYKVTVTGNVPLSPDMTSMPTQPPICKPYTVDIQKPADGKPLEIEVKLEASGEAGSPMDAHQRQ